MKKVEGIIYFFEKYVNLLESEHSKQSLEKNHLINNRITSQNLLLTFVIILLTVASFVIGAINSAPTHLQAIDSLCSFENINYVNNTNFTADCFNLTKQKADIGSIAIKTNLNIFNYLKWAFLGLMILFLGYTIFGISIEKSRDKDMKKLNNKITLVNGIILKLHSLKINFPLKINNKEVLNVLKFFDKQIGQKDYVKCLEEFDSKLLNLLNKFIGEENKKNEQ